MIEKIAIITTHPIQYYAPVFQLLAKEIDLKVFYTWGKASVNKFDAGFKKQVEWDLPLLNGYSFTFVENIAKNQGTHHFKGIDNPTLIQQIENYKPDALLVYGWAWKSHLKAIRYFKGKIPIFFRGDSTLLNNQFGLKSIVKNIFLKWMYRHIDLAFYVGTENKAYFKKYGLKENQLVFVPHAIDNERFAKKKTDEADLLRKKLGIKEEEILILFAGKFEAVKNPLILLEAFIKLDLKNTHLLFVGNGILEQKLKTESKKQKANNNRIHFMDFQNQTKMPVIYQSCDLFCLPSLSETWGLVVNEAMACSKAILVSDKAGCATDLVRPGRNGAIFRSMDLDDLLKKLSHLCSNQNLLHRYGIASKKITAKWSFGEQLNCFLQIINNESQ